MSRAASELDHQSLQRLGASRAVTHRCRSTMLIVVRSMQRQRDMMDAQPRQLVREIEAGRAHDDLGRQLGAPGQPRTRRNDHGVQSCHSKASRQPRHRFDPRSLSRNEDDVVLGCSRGQISRHRTERLEPQVLGRPAQVRLEVETAIGRANRGPKRRRMSISTSPQQDRARQLEQGPPKLPQQPLGKGIDDEMRGLERSGDGFEPGPQALRTFGSGARTVGHLEGLGNVSVLLPNEDGRPDATFDERSSQGARSYGVPSTPSEAVARDVRHVPSHWSSTPAAKSPSSTPVSNRA